MKLEQLGPYRIVKRIGKGGMGAVYEAVCDETGPHAGMHVAIKALNPQLAMAEGFRERFEAEIESLKKLKHDGIVRLFGYGEQDGVVFYSMELVKGPSLEEEINDGRRFDWRETLQIGIQVCRALKHAHDHGVVHRDIKPANLMLTKDNQIKIADFGIARLFGGTQLTTAGGVLGTADYMSPEQADGRAVTDKCDQYGLGGVMYALLAGRPPFKAKTMPEMLQLQRFAEPEPVRRYAVDTPDQLDRLLSQLLAKDPNDRFPNVLVLSRHMEAMEKALSRPVDPDEDDGETTADFLVPTGSATAAIVEEPTRALNAPVVLPHETTREEPQPDIYDAPTLDQPSESAVPSPRARSLVDQPATVSDTTPKKKPASFTTVDEDARRQRELSRGNPMALFAQLGVLVATLGLLVWGGWQLMKPPTADDLFLAIDQAVEQEGPNELSRDTVKKIKSFFERFPDDPRTTELQPLHEQLEFQTYERQARARSKFSGATSQKPIEQIYFRAVALAKDDPAAAYAKLRALVALYDPTGQVKDFASAKQFANDLEEFGDARLLVLARQRLGQLNKQLEDARATQLPALQARFTEATKLQRTNPAQARSMYLAIIELHDGHVWAQEVVNRAKQALNNF